MKLTTEEISHLQMAVCRGSSAARQRLITAFFGYAKAKAAQFAMKHHVDPDGMISAAHEYLCIAADKYDSSRAGFKRCLDLYLDKGFHEELRYRGLITLPVGKAQRDKYRKKIDAAIESCSIADDVIASLPFVDHGLDQTYHKAHAVSLLKKLERVRPRWAELLKRYYGISPWKAQTQREIAQEFRVTFQAIYAMTQRALATLREIAKEESL